MQPSLPHPGDRGHPAEVAGAALGGGAAGLPSAWRGWSGRRGRRAALPASLGALGARSPDALRAVGGSSLGGGPLIKKTGSDPNDASREKGEKQIKSCFFIPSGILLGPSRNGVFVPPFSVLTHPGTAVAFTPFVVRKTKRTGMGRWEEQWIIH